MKILIWFLTIFAATALNMLLGTITGIKAGYVVFYLAVYHIANHFCQKWDNYMAAAPKEKKAAEETSDLTPDPSSTLARIAPSDSGEKDNALPKVVYCRNCGFKLLEESLFCSRCGTKIEK